MYSRFSGTADWSLYPLKRLLFSESSVQNFLIPTANLITIPEPLFCFDCLSPMMVSIISSWSWRFPSSEILSSIVVLLLLWRDDDTRLWSKSLEIFCCLSLSPFNSVTTWQVSESKFSWLSKSPISSGSDSRGCREIWSCSKWEEFQMVPSARETAGFEERLESWKYCKLCTGTFACIWYKVFSIFVILEIILLRVSCKADAAEKGSVAIFVISACCWFNAILETGTVYIIGSCILDLNMLSNCSQGGFNKIVLICTCTWHWCHRWKFEISNLFLWYLFVLQNSYQSKYVKILSNLGYSNSLVKIRYQIFNT